jgi:hypothetical protein
MSQDSKRHKSGQVEPKLQPELEKKRKTLREALNRYDRLLEKMLSLRPDFPYFYLYKEKPIIAQEISSEDASIIASVLTSADAKLYPFAVSYGWGELLKALISACPNEIEYRERKGLTALHIAAARADPVATTLLLEAGANVNAACNDGFTPLGYAVMMGNYSVIAQLMDAGSDPNRELSGGGSVLDFACRFSKYAPDTLLELLKCKGTNPFVVKKLAVEASSIAEVPLRNAQAEYMTREIATLHWLVRDKAEKTGEPLEGIAALPILCLDMLFEALRDVYTKDGARLCDPDAAEKFFSNLK